MSFSICSDTLFFKIKIKIEGIEERVKTLRDSDLVGFEA